MNVHDLFNTMIITMKWKTLREYINRTVNDQFKWNEFIKLATKGNAEFGTSLNDRIEAAQWYAKKRLQKLGQGVARTTYLLNSKTALKIANDIDGIEQNAQEINTSKSSNDIPIARVIRHEHDKIWIVSELVRPVKDNNEFTNLSGHSIQNLDQVLIELDSKSISISDVDDFIKGTWRAIVRGNLAIIDVANLSHWGVTVDQRLVLLDYGYTNDMYDLLPNFIK